MGRLASTKATAWIPVACVFAWLTTPVSAVLVNPRLDYRVNAATLWPPNSDPTLEDDLEVIDLAFSGPGSIEVDANASIFNANASAGFDATLTTTSLAATGGSSFFAGMSDIGPTSAGSGVRLEWEFQLLEPATMNLSGSMSAAGGQTAGVQVRVRKRFPTDTLFNLFDVTSANLGAIWDPTTVLEPGRYEILFNATSSSQSSGAVIIAGSGNTSVDLTMMFTAVGGQPGDFDGSGSVEQGDLNLVLSNWGDPRGSWSNASGFGTTQVDQEELNAVLSNWGAGNAPSFASNPTAVPEPGALLAVFGLGSLTLRRRRA
ncbi:MAG: hypothetical protein AAGF84_02290 [Planctomycetota bacterium]